jgi:hypothetical protein
MAHGEWSDSSPEHDLAYFRVFPCSRSNAQDRLLQCDPNPSKAALEAQAKARTDLRILGKIGSLTVYDLLYFFQGLDREPDMRSVLVGTALNKLHEIHVQDNVPLGTVFPTEILVAGKQPLIKVKFDDGGIYHFVAEDYFILTEGVAMLLNFGPVFQAAGKVVPAGLVMYQPTSRFDFKSLIFHVATENANIGIGPKVGCCQGRVEVRFQIEDGHVIAGRAIYFRE